MKTVFHQTVSTSVIIQAPAVTSCKANFSNHCMHNEETRDTPKSGADLKESKSCCRRQSKSYKER